MLFVLDQDPELAAEYLADKDLQNAIPIVAEFLCAAHVLLDGLPTARRIQGLLYDPMKPVTPFTVWAAQGVENYTWGKTFFGHLLTQRELRFTDEEPNPMGESGHYEALYDELMRYPNHIEEHPLTAPPCRVPPAFKKKSRIENYRDFYFKSAVDPVWSAPASSPQWFADRFALLIRSDVR